MRRKDFSLIELLVVVAVIGILSSLLLPALRRARETAKTIKCASNQRQVHVGLASYTGDYDSYFPVASYMDNPADQSNRWSASHDPWFRTMIKNGYVGANTNPDKWPTREHVFYCDADKCTRASLTDANPYRSYNIGEGCVYNGSTYLPNKIEAFRSPGLTVALADVYHSGFAGNGRLNINTPGAVAWIAVWTPDPNSAYGVTYAHPGLHANFTFIDGHCAAANHVQALSEGYRFNK